MPKEKPLVTCFAKAFRLAWFGASRKLRCQISAIYRGVISARIKLELTAKYPGLGYDLQRKIEARWPPLSRPGTVALVPRVVPDVRPGMYRGATDGLNIKIKCRK